MTSHALYQRQVLCLPSKNEDHAAISVATFDGWINKRTGIACIIADPGTFSVVRGAKIRDKAKPMQAMRSEHVDSSGYTIFRGIKNRTLYRVRLPK